MFRTIKAFFTTSITFFVWKGLEFACVNNSELFEITMKTVTDIINTL